MKTRQFVRRTRIAAPVERVFAWHEAAGALERLTPPGEAVRMVRQSGGIRDGGVVELAIGRWRSRSDGFRSTARTSRTGNSGTSKSGGRLRDGSTRTCSKPTEPSPAIWKTGSSMPCRLDSQGGGFWDASSNEDSTACFSTGIKSPGRRMSAPERETALSNGKMGRGYALAV